MFEDFFENNAPANEEKPNAEQTEHIKAAVMERISPDNAESEEKKMKHKFIRPLVIAAAVGVVGAGSLVSANAANNGTAADTITKVSNEAWREVDGNERVVYYTLPDDKADSSDLKAETNLSDEWSEVDYYTATDDKSDGSDLKTETNLSDEWKVYYYTVPDDEADSSDLKAEPILSGGWSEVYHTVTDDDADILYDYIFSLEKNAASK
ncbi:MAG: hypothetical protein ACI4WS_06370 [Oscillospiraceae bacterium]